MVFQSISILAVSARKERIKWLLQGRKTDVAPDVAYQVDGAVVKILADVKLAGRATEKVAGAAQARTGKARTMKSGIKTSELWVSVCGVALSLFIGMGVISAADAAEVKTQTQAVLEGIIALMPAVAALWYTLSRTVVKARVDLDAEDKNSAGKDNHG